MKYKGYIGKVEYDADAKLFHGEVIGLKDTITFQGTTVDELEREFKKSIDVYLDWCKELNDSKDKVTFNLSRNIIEQLDEAWIYLRHQIKDQQRITKTLIVEKSLEIVLSELSADGDSSTIFEKIQDLGKYNE